MGLNSSFWFDVCDKIAVRLVIPGPSDRGQWDPTMCVDYALVLITVGRVSPRGSVGMLADRVLLGGKWGDDGLGTRQHGDQRLGCPASTPNLAWPQRLCPGATQGLAAWGPTPTRECYSAKGSGVSNGEGGKGQCALCTAVF